MSILDFVTPQYLLFIIEIHLVSRLQRAYSLAVKMVQFFTSRLLILANMTRVRRSTSPWLIWRPRSTTSRVSRINLGWVPEGFFAFGIFNPVVKVKIIWGFISFALLHDVIGLERPAPCSQLIRYFWTCAFSCLRSLTCPTYSTPSTCVLPRFHQFAIFFESSLASHDNFLHSDRLFSLQWLWFLRQSIGKRLCGWKCMFMFGQ